MPQTTQVLARVTLAVLTGSAHAQEARMVPVTVDGERIHLEMRVYEPAAGAPSPTLVFNHGSTGSGTNPEAFTRPLDFPEVARFFVARGWAVVIPARRGRGGAEGRYDEDVADRALRDIQAAMDSILAMPFVDRSRVVIGGQSRGGILSVAYAGQHAEQVKGVINFVGGWNGSRCRHAATINQSLFVRGARYPDETLLALRRRGPILSAVTQPRELCRVPGGWGPRHVPRAVTGVRRTLHLETTGSMGADRRGLPRAPGIAERRQPGPEP
jgi:dienelactone hydrolase